MSEIAKHFASKFKFKCRNSSVCTSFIMYAVHSIPSLNRSATRRLIRIDRFDSCLCCIASFCAFRFDSFFIHTFSIGHFHCEIVRSIRYIIKLNNSASNVTNFFRFGLFVYATQSIAAMKFEFDDYICPPITHDRCECLFHRRCFGFRSSFFMYFLLLSMRLETISQCRAQTTIGRLRKWQKFFVAIKSRRREKHCRNTRASLHHGTFMSRIATSQIRRLRDHKTTTTTFNDRRSRFPIKYSHVNPYQSIL